MGLAEVKFRRKIDKDPNNTSWAKDTSTFGQKILRSQGWEPGQYLGAKDAAQAEHYTAANASFVRVSLKDDMLGLGFKQAREERSTGMDAFQAMLSRLNGKSDVEIQKEQQAKLAVASSLYCDSKFGPMRFVRGGWLVGDQEKPSMDDTKKEEEDDVDKDVKVEDVPEVSLKDVSKKRKADEVSSSDADSSSEDEKAKKKRRKEERKAAKREKSKSAKSTPNDTQDDTEEGSSKKKSKKDKTKTETDSSAAEDKEARRKRKQEKKEKKEKKAAAAAVDDSDSDADKAAKKEKKRRKKELKKAEEAKASASRSASGTATPASATSTPVLRGHHAVRSRWIASKRMATMDDTALNQIFGIKASS